MYRDLEEARLYHTSCRWPATLFAGLKGSLLTIFAEKLLLKPVLCSTWPKCRLDLLLSTDRIPSSLGHARTIHSDD